MSELNLRSAEKSSVLHDRESTSNVLAAFANGVLHSAESTFNGVAQLANAGGEASALSKVSKMPSQDSVWAKGAFIAGEMLGTGALLYSIGRVLPYSKSALGQVARSGSVGALYGGILQPSEGKNLAEERFTKAAEMTIFMSTFEATRVLQMGTGFWNAGGIRRIASEALSGGAAGIAKEVADSSLLHKRPIELTSLAKSTFEGVALGATLGLMGSAHTASRFEKMAEAAKIRQVSKLIKTARIGVDSQNPMHTQIPVQTQIPIDIIE